MTEVTGILRTSDELKLYDETLATFLMSRLPGPLGEKTTVVSDVRVVSQNTNLFPYGIELSEEGMLAWLRKRGVPKNRRFVDEILFSAGLDSSDIKGLVDVSKALSLNDAYWVVPADFDGTFRRYNLYENQFDEILSLVAYTGHRYSNTAHSTSPEFTTGGMLAKTWRQQADGTYLYKTGSEGFVNAGNEPFSEYLASQVAKRLGLDAVEYDLVRWEKRLASKCRLFCSIDTSFVPIYDIVGNASIDDCVYFCDSLGESFGTAVREMLVFDALIMQEDRHYGNFGLMRDNKTGEFTRFAPLFDNGMSLLHQAMDSDFRTPESTHAYALTRTPPYRGHTFGSLAVKYMTETMHKRLGKMFGFTFVPHPKYNMPESRIKALESELRARAGMLLDIPPIERERRSSGLSL